MPDAVESNVIINVEALVKRSGIANLAKSVTQLRDTLLDLEKRTYTIDVRLNPQASQQINSLLSQVKQVQQAVGPGGLLSRTSTISPNAPVTSRGTTRSSDGSKEQRQLQEEVVDGYHRQEKAIGKKNAKGKESTKNLYDEVNLLNKVNIDEQKRLAVAERVQELRNRQKHEELKQNRAIAQQQEAILRKQGYRQVEEKRTQQWYPGSRFRAVNVQKEFVKLQNDGTVAVRKTNEFTGKLESSTRGVSRQWQHLVSAAKQLKSIARDINRENAAYQKQGIRGVGKRLLEASKAANKARLESVRIAQVQASVDQRRLQYISQGFSELSKQTRTNPITGLTTEIQRFARATRTGLASYEVAMRTINTRTGEFTESTLRGAQAAKFLGDSIFRAGEKVLIWTASTSVLFSFFRLIRTYNDQVRDLEKNTVFLARVSDRLTTSIDGVSASFGVKLNLAKNLTNEIMELSAAIGGNAIEAQKAAASFLRSGQSQEEALLSTKAALLAARIAEVDVAKAAEMLTSAYLQFNLTAKDLLPTLDSLNTLSNNYKVTTDDLLQSISRAGSVIADHNGTLTELAAMTALVSQVTSRTGTQIGNAFKTISSRMDRINVRDDLFEKLGVSTVDLEGNARSLMNMLLQLQNRMESLSDTERKELSLQIAGVRQRNIFNAALKTADQALIAHNKALFSGNSAMEEYEEQSKTLDSAIERLQATFSKMANTSRGPFGVMARDISNLLSALLEFLSIADGTPVRLAAILAVMFALRSAITYVSSGFVKISVDAMLAAGALTATQVQSDGLNRSFSAGIRTMGGWRTAMAAVIGTIKVAAHPMNILALFVMGGMHWFAKSREEQMKYRAALESSVEITDKEIAAIDKKREAIIQTTNAIVQQIEEYHLLGKARKDALEFGDESHASKIAERIQKIPENITEQLKSLGFSTDGNDPLNKSAIIQQTAAKEQDLLEEKLAKNREQRQNRLRRIKEIEISLNKEVRGSLNDLFKINPGGILPVNPEKYIFGSGPGSMAYERKYGSMIINSEDPVKVLNEMIDLEEERMKANGELESSHYSQLIITRDAIETQKQLKREQEDQIKLLDETNDRLEKMNIKDPKLQEYFYEARDRIFGAKRELEEFLDKNDKVKEAYSALVGSTPRNVLEDRLKKVNETIASINSELDEMNAKGVLEGLEPRHQEELRKSLEESGNEVVKIVNALDEMAASHRKAFISSTLGVRNQLNEIVALHNVARKISASGGSEITAEFKELEAREDILRKRIERNKLYDIFADPTTKAAISEDTQAAINDLRDLELQKVEKLLEKEREIAEERKKSADEVLRAVGGLSSEDKLRLIAQAEFFSANPGLEISPTQQLFQSSAANKIGRQFFGARYADKLKKGDPLSDLILKAGGGVTREVIEAEAELRKQRGGRSTEQIAEEAEKRLRQLTKQESLEKQRQIEIKNAQISVDGNATVRINAKNITAPLDAPGFSDGARVFKPKGTDIVPAMLTPGETVVSAEDSARNRGAINKMMSGGTVYAARGGVIDDGSARISIDGMVGGALSANTRAAQVNVSKENNTYLARKKEIEKRLSNAMTARTRALRSKTQLTAYGGKRAISDSEFDYYVTNLRYQLEQLKAEQFGRDLVSKSEFIKANKLVTGSAKEEAKAKVTGAWMASRGTSFSDRISVLGDHAKTQYSSKYKFTPEEARELVEKTNPIAANFGSVESMNKLRGAVASSVENLRKTNAAIQGASGDQLGQLLDQSIRNYNELGRNRIAKEMQNAAYLSPAVRDAYIVNAARNELISGGKMKGEIATVEPSARLTGLLSDYSVAEQRKRVHRDLMRLRSIGKSFGDNQIGRIGAGGGYYGAHEGRSITGTQLSNFTYNYQPGNPEHQKILEYYKNFNFRELIKATRLTAGISDFASRYPYAGTFHDGGVVPGNGEKTAVVEGGEGIIPKNAMQAMQNSDQLSSSNINLQLNVTDTAFDLSPLTDNWNAFLTDVVDVRIQNAMNEIQAAAVKPRLRPAVRS